MTTIFNESPYYETDENYHKIIFNPNVPLQSRELSQIQDVIQNQIQQVGEFNFKNGAMIIPGNISYENKLISIKLESLHNGIAVSNFIEEFINIKITGNTTNVRAIVVHVDKETIDDPPILYIKYISGGVSADGTLYAKFMQNEILTISDTKREVTIKDVTDYTTSCALAIIKAGVYYVDGYFVQNSDQTISLSKFDNVPSCQVGFDVITSIASANNNSDLYDNSSGFNNPIAVGADRMHINLSLTKYDYFANLDNIKFVSLLMVKDGTIQSIINKTNLNKLGDILAKRTLEESGHYIVDPFKYEYIEYRNNNRGEWLPKTPYVAGDVVSSIYNNTTYYLTAIRNGISDTDTPEIKRASFRDGSTKWLITDKPVYNNGMYYSSPTDTLEQHVANAEKAIVKISKGKAYIYGNEVDLNVGYKLLEITKSRTSKVTETFTIKPPNGQYFIVMNVFGLPVITNIDEKNRALLKHDLLDTEANVIGSCRIRNFEYYAEPSRLDVNLGSSYVQYKLSIFDIEMNADMSLNDINGIASKDGTFSADVIEDIIKIPGFVETGSTQSSLDGIGNELHSSLKSNDTIYILVED